MRHRIDGNDFGIEHKRASRPIGGVNRSVDAHDALSCTNSARDDPIDRTVGDNLGGAVWHIARDMPKFGRLSTRPGLLQAPRLQPRQMGKRLHPDRQFEKIDCHDRGEYARLVPITPVNPGSFSEFRP